MVHWNVHRLLFIALGLVVQSASTSTSSHDGCASTGKLASRSVAMPLLHRATGAGRIADRLRGGGLADEVELRFKVGDRVLARIEDGCVNMCML